MRYSNGLDSRLIALLPPDGTPKTNAQLRKELKVSDDEYWEVRNRLLNQGRVTKLPGRGGKTALVVDNESKTERKDSRGLPRLISGVFLLSLAGLTAAGIYGFASIDSENYPWWNVLALVSGAISVTAVGVSLLIFKVQAESAQLEADGQARVLQRLESVVTQAAASSSDARDLLLVMQPAVDATSDTDGSAVPGDTTAEEDAAAEEDTSSATDSVILHEHGIYYLPPAVPMNVLSDLVQWWNDEGETGRWTLSKLIGGYRRFNSSGNVTGVPWILTFDGGTVGARSFRLAYSGRRKGPAVNELIEGGVWHDLV